MALEPVGTLLDIYVSSRAVFGTMQQGFAWQWTADSMNIETYNWRFPDENNASYDTDLNCWSLNPDQATLWEITAPMHLADCTVNSNSWVEVTPSCHYQCVRNTDFTQPSSISFPSIAEDTSFMVYMQRDLQTIPGTQWSISFGNGWLLQFCKETSPRVTDNLGNYYTLKSSDVNIKEYQSQIDLTWKFHVINGDLHIQSNALRSKWVIPSPVVGTTVEDNIITPGAETTIGAGIVTVTASSGSLTCACSAFAFQNAGAISTGLIDFGAPLPALDSFTLEECGPDIAFPTAGNYYYRVWGDVPNGCSATVTPLSVNGNLGTFQLNLTGAGDLVDDLQIATLTIEEEVGGITTAGTAVVSVVATGLPQTTTFLSQITVAGTATATGTVQVTMNVTGLTGYPKTFNVNTTSGDTDSVLAASIVTALNADADLASMFNIYASGATIYFKCNTVGVFDNAFLCTINAAEGFTQVASTVTTTWTAVQYTMQANVGDTAEILASRAAYILSQDPYLNALFTPDSLGDALTFTAIQATTTEHPADSALTVYIQAGISGCVGLSSSTAIIGSVTRTNSSVTPFISKFEVIRMPTYTMPSTGQSWLRATDWFDGGECSLYKVWASNQATLKFNHWLVKDGVEWSVNGVAQTPMNGVTLLEALGNLYTAAGLPLLNGYPTGQLAVYFNVAYQMYDTVAQEVVNPNLVEGNAAANGAWVRRMTGITMLSAEQGGMVNTDSNPFQLEWRVHNRYAMFNNQLGRMPCLEGYTVDQALVLLSMFAGVLPSDINDWSGTTQPFIVQPSGTTYSVSYPTITAKLTDPGKRYYQSVWQVQPGETADSVVQKILKIYPLVQFQFGMNGELYIYQLPYAALPPGDLFATSGANTLSYGQIDVLHTLSKTKLSGDMSGMTNMITTEGKSSEGNPLFATIMDTASINGPAANFTGVVLQTWMKDDSLTLQSDVQQACQASFNRRHSGHPTIDIGENPYAGVVTTPATVVLFADGSLAMPTTVYYNQNLITGEPRGDYLTPVLVDEVHLTLGGKLSPQMVICTGMKFATYFV